MKELKDVTCCVADHGLGLPIAQRMAKACKRVLYWSPFEMGMSKIRNACLGDGFPEIERTLDFWPIKGEIDLFVFPDIEHSGLQLELSDQGFPVWGSKKADTLELNREKFLSVLNSIGLQVPEYKVINGLEELRDYLRDKEDQYIKISRWRGDIETTHWRSWALDRYVLDHWAIVLGPLQQIFRFLVFPAIDTDIEIGVDTYTVDGQFPNTMLNGIEWKDKSYFGVVTPRAEMPQQVGELLEAFGPILGQYQMRNQFSAELRIKEDKAYFLDPTTRLGLPSTGSQMTLWKNFPEIVWAGANGEMLDPEWDQYFSMECAIKAKDERDSWVLAKIPDALKQHVKLASACYMDGLYCFPPDDTHGNEIGWLVATGSTPIATLEEMKDLCEQLPDGLYADIESLANVIREVETAKEQDIPVTDKPMPEPEAVIDNGE